jgi:GT2 family glycosyltransferase
VSASLSIVIPSHCRTDLLAGCLASLGRHAPPQTEITVVDDGSPEESVSRTAREFAGVRVVRLERRHGFCGAANAGIRAAQSDIVELLNDDTLVTAGWAEAVLPLFDDATVAAVAPLVLCGPESRCIDSAGDRYYLGGIAGKRGHGQPWDAVPLQGGPVFGASASSAFYRRDALLQVGAFPDAFGAYFEDVDLAFRLHRAGYRIMFAPRSVVNHRPGSSYGRPGRRLVAQQSLNEERVFWRNMPATAMGSALPRHLLVLFGKAMRRWDDGTLSAWLTGRLRIVGEIGALRRHRSWLRTLGPDVDPRTWLVERTFDPACWEG